MRSLKVTSLLVLCIISKIIFIRSEITEKLYRSLHQYRRYKIESYYKKRQTWVTSNLGSIMFKNDENEQYRMRNKTFLILYWKYWHKHKERLPGDLFANCSVKNCKFTTSMWDMAVADAVVICLQWGEMPIVTKNRPKNQRWIFWGDESPVNMFFPVMNANLTHWASIFNWSMTYRSDSDVPVPYGRTVPLKSHLLPNSMFESITSLIPNWEIKQRKVYIAAMMSHCCVKERNDYIQQLQKYLDVDVYGDCSRDHKESCPGHAGKDCPYINKYLFYLAFENSKCRQYISEKTFYNAYGKGSIPIIMGAPKLDCERLLPPHSFLHVKDYPDPKSLADKVKGLVKNVHKLLMYHQWRHFFKVTNEHGYYGTNAQHICRVCEALNFNDEKPKVYGKDDLRMFSEVELLCEEPIVVYDSCSSASSNLK